MDTNRKRLLRPPAAAAYLDLSESTLAKMHVRGDGPPFIKLGIKAVAYDSHDLDRFIESRRRTSTSDPG